MGVDPEEQVAVLQARIHERLAQLRAVGRGVRVGAGGHESLDPDGGLEDRMLDDPAFDSALNERARDELREIDLTDGIDLTDARLAEAGWDEPGPGGGVVDLNAHEDDEDEPDQYGGRDLPGEPEEPGDGGGRGRIGGPDWQGQPADGGGRSDSDARSGRGGLGDLGRPEDHEDDGSDQADGGGSGSDGQDDRDGLSWFSGLDRAEGQEDVGGRGGSHSRDGRGGRGGFGGLNGFGGRGGLGALGGLVGRDGWRGLRGIGGRRAPEDEDGQEDDRAPEEDGEFADAGPRLLGNAQSSGRSGRSGSPGSSSASGAPRSIDLDGSGDQGLDNVGAAARLTGRDRPSLAEATDAVIAATRELINYERRLPMLLDAQPRLLSLRIVRWSGVLAAAVAAGLLVTALAGGIARWWVLPALISGGAGYLLLRLPVHPPGDRHESLRPGSVVTAFGALVTAICATSGLPSTVLLLGIVAIGVGIWHVQQTPLRIGTLPGRFRDSWR
ncbi:hypothetical protein [Kineosporia babensis]|uniref:Uncharacterized protein n=1 Tax=Kineosporia babensis TaxID=499548 RepID=A0A9X1SWC9_9ACTN|nr:hypothetical protein [Kineosporia babensis]MCD5314619.1 hypothetical protein [Kineosporia babensis]